MLCAQAWKPGSQHAGVSDADIVTGDDGIAIRASGRHFVGGAAVAPPCERIRVSRSKITSEVMGFRIGVGEGLIRDVTIEDVEIRHASIGASFETFYWKPEGNGLKVIPAFDRDSLGFWSCGRDRVVCDFSMAARHWR